MHRLLRIALCAIAIIVLSSLTLTCYEQAGKPEKAASKDDLYTNVELFATAVSIIRSNYVEEVDSQKLIYGALAGMLGSLDDFSQFMTPDEYNEIQVEATGEFGGIGIELSQRDGVLTVIAPIEGTPAARAGIQPFDRIIKINGTSTKEMTIDDAIKLMRGGPGTQVTITVWRESDERIIDVPLTRAVISVKSISDVRLIDGKIGYVKVIEFQENTPRDLEAALKKLEAQGMDALILDLRNNPGGLLETAADVAEKFLPKGAVIVTTKSRVPEQNAVFVSSGTMVHPAYPIIVLVNGGSASGSEIVAGALKDHRRALILGTKTFGKASVQTVIPLKDGSALRLTTALYYTPNGTLIRGQGIQPDIVIEKEPAKEPGILADNSIFERVEDRQKKKGEVKAAPPAAERDASDNQLTRAIDLMKAIKLYPFATPESTKQ